MPTKCNKEIMAYLIKNQKGRSNKELTEMVNKKFGKNLKESSIKRYKNLEHLKSGRDYKTLYEIGDEKEFLGYIMVKVAQPHSWKYKGVIEWEKHHGEVPKGYNIIYLDGNRKNTNIENLACVSNAELGALVKYGKVNGNAELRKAQVNLAKLKQVIKRKQKIMGRKPNPKKEYKLKMPFYCKECGKCETDSEAYNNLKTIHNTGYTNDVYCKKREQTVYGI